MSCKIVALQRFNCYYVMFGHHFELTLKILSNGWFNSANITSILDDKSCMRLDLKNRFEGSCYDYMSELRKNETEKIWKSCGRNDLIFDRSVVESSIPEDFEMICDNAYQKSLYSSLFTCLDNFHVPNCYIFLKIQFLDYLISSYV